MNWILLIIAGFFEAGFALCLSKANKATGMDLYYWWFGFFACLFLSMYLLYRAALVLPIGTAYAVWTGVGALCTVMAGIFFLKEPVSFWRLFFLFTLISSIVGLKAVSS